MRIEQSQVDLSAAGALTRRKESRIEVAVSVAVPEPAEDTVVLGCGEVEPCPEPALDPRLQLLWWLVERMLGRKIRLFRLAAQGAPAETRFPVQPVSQVHVRQTETRIETETMAFRAEGAVKTAEGRELSLSAELRMERRLVERIVDGVTQGAVDPLALDLDGGGCSLSEERAELDLDADERRESVARFSSGEGVLFLDRDGDGRASSGSELFGPRTGDGFAELAAMDADGNGWIDESDPVFGTLRVWVQNSGDEKVYTLRGLGVGAIYTDSVRTPFDFRLPTNALLGQVRRSGVYLFEDGRAGIVQQVDLAI